jgi:hypothetical protein
MRSPLRDRRSFAEVVRSAIISPSPTVNWQQSIKFKSSVTVATFWRDDAPVVLMGQPIKASDSMPKVIRPILKCAAKVEAGKPIPDKGSLETPNHDVSNSSLEDQEKGGARP